MCLRLVLLLILLPALAPAAPAVRQATLALDSGEELTFEIHGRPDASLRVLWIAPAFGLQARHRQVAAALAREGMEVWLTDLAESLFLPAGVNTLRDLPGAPVSAAIHRLARDRELVVVSNGYGAIPVLRGIRAWQARADNGRDRLLGAILFSPALLAQVPALGAPPNFLPVADATSVPLFVFQPMRSGHRWQLPHLLTHLQAHAPVYVRPLPGVTALFYAADRAPETRRALNRLPAWFTQAVALLRAHPVPHRALPLPAAAGAHARGLDTGLATYRGRIRPVPIHLPQLDGSAFAIDDYRGRVTVINFWATWCPPCVQEIPSLNRLQQRMAGRPFTLVSVNYAEPRERVQAFLKRVPVDFPVLIDPDGRTAARWQVMAFPSTFVIGPAGRIRFGVNAAIDWDAPEVVRRLEALLPPAP